MPQSQPEIRGFKAVFTVIGVIYVMLASSMLVRGVSVLHDFAVPESLTAAPVFQDFFYFFYQYMAAVGLLTVLFGHVARDRRSQTQVAGSFAVLNLLIAARDLSTSDSPFGNRLYRGEATLMFVFISLALAVIFGALAIAGIRRPARSSGPATHPEPSAP